MPPTPGNAGRTAHSADLPRCATLTGSARRALSILHPEFPLTSALFAHYMWPTSECWLRERDAVRGIRVEARWFLASLERAGLVRRCEAGAGAAAGYVLTPWGECAADLPARPDRLH